jgi:imidazolonepropionase-like amidohydrolase
MKGARAILKVDRVDDIDAAIRFGRAEHVRIVIAGGAEAWKIAGRLAAAHVAVLSGAMNNIPVSFDALNARQDNDAILRRAGVEVVLIGNTGGGDDDTGYNARNIRYEAGYAVAYGMSYADALRSVTLAPATVFGVADRIGALAAGRDANVVVWSGDPFEFATVAEHVFVRGREFADPSRQDQLIERYRTLPRSTGPQ